MSGMSPIILIDRDEAVRNAIQFAFGLEGLGVAVYAAGEAATPESLAAARCLIVDQDLDRQPGLDLIQDLRRRGVKAPAILLATNPGRLLRKAAKAAHVCLVEKPLLSDLLLERVRAALDGERPRPPP